MNIDLNIYSYTVTLSGLNEILLHRIRSDFSYFVTDSLSSINKNLIIEIDFRSFTAKEIPIDTIPQIQNEKVIKYHSNDSFIYNYHYEVLLIEKSNHITIISENINRLHEIIYLYILSKSGKYLDRHGFHKIHGFAVQTSTHNLIYCAPSHGGKTSTFLTLIKDNNLSIFSEDTPLINAEGKLLPFPLRVGVKNKDALGHLDPQFIYEIERKEYGKKFLYPISHLPNSIASNNSLPTLLLFAYRSNNQKTKFIKLSKLKTFYSLIPHMIIGIGLPMIIEFFLEPHPSDLLTRLKIFLRRCLSAIHLTMHSNAYNILLTEDIERNKKALQEFLNRLR